MKIATMILFSVCMIGCSAGPARSQPVDPVVNERLGRLADMAGEQTKEIAVLGEKITDARFVEMGNRIDTLRTEMTASVAKIHEMMEANHRDVLAKQEANHRTMMAKMDRLEEGQAIPWKFAIATGLVGGVGVGGVAAPAVLSRRRKKVTATEDEGDS